MYLTSKFVVLLMLPVLFLLGCSQPPMKPVPGTEVATESGRVVGVTGDEHVIHWQDIPFALPPEGALRWRAPQPYRNASSEFNPGKARFAFSKRGQFRRPMETHL